MSKYSNEISEAEYGRQQWQFMTAKVGLTEAGNIKASGHNPPEAHAARKEMRRAINQIHSKLNPSECSNEITAGLSHASRVVAEISSGLDTQERLKQSKSPSNGMTVLRNSADFAKHFRTDEQYNRAGDENGVMNLSDFFRGVAGMKTTPAVSNALSVGTDAGGGFTVPSILMPGILSALTPVSSLLTAGVGIVMLEEGAKTYTTAGINAIPVASWRLEAGTLATSDATFRAVVATPKSLAFQFKISRELLADGQGIETALFQAIAQAFAKELDRAGLRGSGVNPEPRGLLNTVGVQAITNGANGAALASYANMFSGVQAILQADAPMPTACIMSPRSLVKLGQLVTTTNEYLEPPTMLGNVKQIATSQIPNTLTVGTSSDCSEIYLGDFSNMLFAMREAVSIQMLREAYAGTGEIGFACHVRADVLVNYPQAFAVVTGVKA
jgi:HK97 family phage major capsid protein